MTKRQCWNCNQSTNLPKKKEGWILVISFVFLICIHLKIKIKKISKNFKKPRLSSSSLVSSGTSYTSNFLVAVINIDQLSLIDMTSIIFGVCLILIYHSLNYKVNTLSPDELNKYPNYYYIYIQHLIAFPVLSCFLLLVLYAKQPKMIKILYNALKT